MSMHTIGRILATSDIHGQNKKFHMKTMQHEPEQDLLIVCGDLIDRGKENLKCLAACQKLQ
ncbi:metallophosphoesterase [Pectinatus haikarae]